MAKEKEKGTTEEVAEEPSFDIQDLVKSIFEAYGQNPVEDAKKRVNENISAFLRSEIAKYSKINEYNILILFDSTSMVKGDADNIYNAVTKFSGEKPLLLMLYSNGGAAGSAYLIGQLCREYSNGCLSITVPRQAKSAATLLCCAADQIHMGSLSELGPIDPQIDGLPALGLKYSIEHIAKLVKETPESAEMFAKYLSYSLKPIDIGYYERVAESAAQYAEKLLDTHADKLPKTASEIAYDLVYTYKDHGFVLDVQEAKEIFGNDVIQVNTEEYQLGNSLYKALSFIDNMTSYLGYKFYLIGSIDSEPNFMKR